MGFISQESTTYDLLLRGITSTDKSPSRNDVQFFVITRRRLVSDVVIFILRTVILAYCCRGLPRLYEARNDGDT